VGADGLRQNQHDQPDCPFYEPRGAGFSSTERICSRPRCHRWHEQIGIVTQENFLFTGTVMEKFEVRRAGRDGRGREERPGRWGHTS